MPDALAFLRPARVAIFGATPHPGQAQNLFHTLRSSPARLDIFPINPKYPEVWGARCWPNVQALDGPPDVAFVITPAATVPGIVRECGQAGVPRVVVCSSGFSESAGGADLERELVAAVAAGGIQLLGPNCIGFVNVEDGIYGLMAPQETIPADLFPGNVAVVSQSGGLLISTLELAARRGLGLQSLVSVGNEAQTTAADLITHLLDQPGVQAVGYIVEGIRDAGRLSAALRKAVQLEKPVVVLKLGISEVGQRIAATHTGSISGPRRLTGEFFRRAGAPMVQSIDQLVESLLLLSSLRQPRDPSIFLLTISGGTNILVADRAQAAGLPIEPPPPALREQLQAVLPAWSSVSNPLDLSGQALVDARILPQVLDALDGQGIGLTALILHMKKAGGGESIRRAVTTFCEHRRSGAGSPARVVISTISEGLTGFWAPYVKSAGVAFLQDIDAIESLRHLLDWWRQTAQPLPPPVAAGAPAGTAPTGREPAEILGGLAALEQVQALGLPTARTACARTAAELEEALTRVGLPVTLKANATGGAHKTERGGVVPGVQTAAAAVRAFEAIRRAVPAGGTFDGVLVQEHVEGAQEVFVGFQRDRVYGPAVLVGWGGIYVELLDDVAVRLGAVDEDEAAAMISETRIGAVLHGYRGRAYDTAALAALLARISRLADEPEAGLLELDLNPVFVFPPGAGVKVVDARLRVLSRQMSNQTRG